MPCHDTAWHGLVLHGTAWYGMVRHGMVWSGMALSALNFIKKYLTAAIYSQEHSTIATFCNLLCEQQSDCCWPQIFQSGPNPDITLSETSVVLSSHPIPAWHAPPLSQSPVGRQSLNCSLSLFIIERSSPVPPPPSDPAAPRLGKLLPSNRPTRNHHRTPWLGVPSLITTTSVSAPPLSKPPNS